MPTCCLCDKPPDRLFAGRFPMCLQHYSDARVGRLPDDKARKLEAIRKGLYQPTDADPAEPRGEEAGEVEGVSEPGEDGEVADRKGGD